MPVADDLGVRDAKLAAKVEQIVLDVEQHRRQVIVVQPGDQHADGAVAFIDGTVGFHPQAVLLGARAVAKAGGAVVAGTGVDFRKAVAHGVNSCSTGARL